MICAVHSEEHEGFTAFADDFGLADCPYADKRLKESWESGWRTAERGEDIYHPDRESRPIHKAAR